MLRSPRLLRAAPLALAGALAVAACGSTEPEREPGSVGRVAGNGQSATVGEPLAADLTVEVLDRSDVPLEGAVVDFVAVSGGGSAEPATDTTGPEGEASTTWVLGTEAGRQELEARVSGVAPATFTATANPGDPAALAVVSGDSQTGEAGQPLSEPIVVEAADRFGNPVPGAGVGFEAASGGGSFDPASASAGPDGRAGATWTLGSALGGQEGRAELSGGGSASVGFTATAVDGTPPSLTVESPSGSSFDVDGDLRADLRLTYSDDPGSGIDPTTLSVTIDRPLGGGAAAGGLDAGAELAGDFDTVSETQARYELPPELEVPRGDATLTATIADEAGNETTETSTFTVSGTDPDAGFRSPAAGDTVADVSGFGIEVTLADPGGRVDPATLSVTSSARLGGIFDPETREISDTVPAGTELAGLFGLSGDSLATLTVPDSLAFFAGDATLTAAVADRVGNVDSADVSFTVPATTGRVYLPDTSAAGVGDTVVVELRINRFPEMLSAEGLIAYDDAVLRALGGEPTAFTAGFSAAVNTDTSGEVRFALAGAQPVEGDGAVLTLSFEAVASGSSALEIVEIAFDEGAITAVATDGAIGVP